MITFSSPAAQRSKQWIATSFQQKKEEKSSNFENQIYNPL